MIAYPAMLDVPRELAWFLASLLADHRRELGTCPGARALSCFKQAVSALVWFREKRSIPLTGKGFGISQATSYRYLDEAIDVLAVCAPDLHDVLRRVAAEGWSHVILDGNIVDSGSGACHVNCVSRRCTKIDSPDGRSEGTPSDAEHIVSS